MIVFLDWRYICQWICVGLAIAMLASEVSAAPDAEPPWVTDYRAAVKALHPPAEELWISEFDEANWRYVAIYRGWATKFNEVATWHPLTANMSKVKGSLITTELTPAGALVDVELLRSSGSDELDAYALEAARAQKSAISIPRNLPRQGARIKVVAMVGFLVPEGGGRVRPLASVSRLAFQRFTSWMSETAAVRLSGLVRPGKGSVVLKIAFKQGRVVSVEADPREGSLALRDFAVREFKRIAEAFPNSPRPEVVLILPLVLQ